MSVINLPNSGLGWDFRQCPNAPIPGAIGGHEYGGAQYLFLYQGAEFGAGDLHIHALKSTDLGVTWADTGNINVPPLTGGLPNAVPTYTTCMDGSTVYLMAVDIDGTGATPSDATTGPILLWKYNLAADGFDAGGPLSGAPTVYKGWNGTSYPIRSGICLHLLRRGPGDMLLLYTGVESIGADKWARIFVANFNGSSCSGGTMLAGQAGASFPYIERCAAFDASHNLHVILSRWPDFHFWYHVGMDSAGSFGSFQTIETNAYFQNDTSNLLDFPAPSDTIAFLGVRNRSSSGDNGDLAIYSAPGGTLNPTWTFHNLPSTANPVQDPVIAPDWIAALGYLDGTLHAYWTQTGVPHTWNVNGKLGEIRSSTAVATDLTTWSAETSVMGPFDGSGKHWGAGQVGVWSGSSIGLGVLGNFEGVDGGGTGLPIETSKLLVFPPSGGGGTAPTVSCGSPPSGTVGVAYSHAMISTHTGAFTVAVTAGALPHGLTMDSAGIITGTPTAAGTFVYTAKITDSTSGGLRSTRSFAPVTIGTSIQGYDISDNVCGGYAFSHGGAQYAFLRGGGLSTPEGDQKIHAFKSADSGATWVELDAGGAIPHAAVGGFGSAYAVGASGTTAYVITARVTRTGPDNDFNGIGVTTFDLTTGAWGATTNHSTPQVTIWHGDPPGGPRRPSLQLVVLGSGSYLLFYGGPFEVLSGGSYGRVYCATFNGSTFGAEVMVPGQAGNLNSYTAVGAVAGSGGIAQLLFLDDHETLYSVGRQASGTFGTPQTITNQGYFPNTVDFSPPCLYQAGGVESIGVLGWINSATPAELHVFHAPMALNPAWQDSFTCAVVDDTSGGPPTSPTYAVVVAEFVNVATCFSLSASTDTIWAMWTTTAASGGGTISRIWYCQADTATLTWTAPAMLVESAHQGSAPFVKPVASQVVSWSGDGLGVIVLTQDYDSLAEVAESIFIPAAGGSDSATCTITISAPTIGLGCASPPDGVVGVEYLHRFPVSGGIPPYTFAIISGSLPPGLTLDSLRGEVSGTPTLAGDFEFVIQVSDGFGSTVGTCDIVITVTDLPAPGITCDSPPAGEVGVSYSHTFPVTEIPDRATVSYSITGGALPPGLTLNTATGEVTGTPTTEGHYHFTITLTVTEVAEDILTDAAGSIIYTTAGDTIFVTHGIGGL